MDTCPGEGDRKAPSIILERRNRYSFSTIRTQQKHQQEVNWPSMNGLVIFRCLNRRPDHSGQKFPSPTLLQEQKMTVLLRNKKQLGSLEEEIEKRTMGKGNMRRDRKKRLGPPCIPHQLEYDSWSWIKSFTHHTPQLCVFFSSQLEDKFCLELFHDGIPLTSVNVRHSARCFRYIHYLISSQWPTRRGSLRFS